MTPLLRYKEYIQYFFYLGVNWNFVLAWFIVVREIKGEKKYGIATTGIDNLRSSVAADELNHASIYQPVNFYTAEKLFDELQPADYKTGFVDIGCGKGRALAMAAHKGFAQITGIDFSPKLCNDAIMLADALEALKPLTQITIECIDAREFEIPDDTGVLFLFNPFDELVMADFLPQVMKSLERKPRHLKILYANPQCKKLWLKAGFAETHSFRKLNYLEGAVLEWNEGK